MLATEAFRGSGYWQRGLWIRRGVDHWGAFSTTFIPQLKQKYYFKKRRKTSCSQAPFFFPGDLSWSWEGAPGTDVCQGAVAVPVRPSCLGKHRSLGRGPGSSDWPHTLWPVRQAGTLPCPARREGRDTISLVSLSRAGHVSS